MVDLTNLKQKFDSLFESVSDEELALWLIRKRYKTMFSNRSTIEFKAEIFGTIHNFESLSASPRVTTNTDPVSKDSYCYNLAA